MAAIKTKIYCFKAVIRHIKTQPLLYRYRPAASTCTVLSITHTVSVLA